MMIATSPATSFPAPSYRNARLLLVLAILAALLNSTAPSPIYQTYIAHLQLPQIAGAAIFAFYAVGTLCALLAAGRFGDRVRDRRKIIIPGLVIVALGAGVFALADSLGMLLLGRFLAGLGTGAIAGTATAAIYDLERPERRQHAAVIATVGFTLGATLGPVLTSIALYFDVWPLVTPFATIAVTAVACAIGLVRAAWPPVSSVAVAVVDPELAVPPCEAEAVTRRLASPFLLAASALSISWVVGSLLMALGPAIAVDVFHLPSVALAGLMPAAFQLSAGIGQYLFGKLTALRAIRIGLIGLAAISVLLLVGAEMASLPILILAMPAYGLAYGAAFVGGAGLVNETAVPKHRARTVSRFYICGYLSNAFPVLALGSLVDALGLHDSLRIYTVFVLACLAAIMLLAWQPSIARAAGRPASAA